MKDSRIQIKALPTTHDICIPTSCVSNSHTFAWSVPFVNFERFTNRSILNDSQSCQTPGVSPAELEDLSVIKAVNRSGAECYGLHHNSER
jgi:hypothetical protein